MTQETYLTEQTPNQAAPAAAHSSVGMASPTFQRPVAPATQHQPAEQAPNIRAQMQMQQPAQTVAQPQPLVAGGQGPLAGRGGSVQPQRTQAYQAPQPAPAMVDAGPETPPIAADQRPDRPTFPAAPSKVLQEVYARGGDGHIRQTDEGPAFDSHVSDGPMLEGAYPYPGEEHQTFTVPEPAPTMATAPVSAAPAGQPGQAERPSPRLQHADTAYRNQLAGLGEPNLSAHPGQPAASTDGAFWNFESGQTVVREDEDRGALWPFIILAALFLIAILAYGAYASWNAWQSTAAAPAEPVFISAFEGPERIVPADTGGLQIEGTTLSVLNPEAEIVNGELAPPPAPPVAEQGEGFVAETDITIAETIETVVVAPVVTDPNFRADVSRPVTRPADVPSAFVAPQPEPAPTPEPVAEATPAPATPAAAAPVAEAGLVTSAPSGLYVQEGSYSSLANAKQAYASLVARNSSAMSGIDPSYHKVVVNGQTYYRLYLTGFLDSPAADMVGFNLGRNRSNWRVVNG